MPAKTLPSGLGMPSDPSMVADDVAMRDLVALAEHMVALKDTLIEQLGVVATLVQAAQAEASTAPCQCNHTADSGAQNCTHSPAPSPDAGHYHLID